MDEKVVIDGSQGEGGGQMLRTSLALSAAYGKPFEMVNIRAKREKPGLKRQHLTCVRAVAHICGAQVEGDEVGSMRLSFMPGKITGGTYQFDIGTAGSVTLVAQTVIPVLLRAEEPSTVTITGGTHVPFAPDLADLYQVETRSFNQAVKRNIKRFPENFRFQLTKAELDEVITNCDNPDRLRFSPQTPYAFTEQGIAMLSGVLNSDVAVQVLVVKNSLNKLLHAVDVARFNAQYGNSLAVKTSDKFHDRFLIIDKAMLIHVGASLNHLGKKCFAFSSMDKSNIPDVVAKI